LIATSLVVAENETQIGWLRRPAMGESK
jgi:hypothetical protein